MRDPTKLGTQRFQDPRKSRLGKSDNIMHHHVHDSMIPVKLITELEPNIEGKQKEICCFEIYLCSSKNLELRL